jgi:hypothetical protein
MLWIISLPELHAAMEQVAVDSQRQRRMKPQVRRLKNTDGFGIAIDSAGKSCMFTQSGGNEHIVRMVDLDTGTLTTIAGTGEPGYSGDGGPAIEAQFSAPVDVALDPNGHCYIADYFNNVVRRIKLATGVITTIAGTGEKGYSGDGGPAIEARLAGPQSVAVDSTGSCLYLAEDENNVVRRIKLATGIITTIAGTGEPGYSGDGGPAIEAHLDWPQDIALDSNDYCFVADTGNHAIRRVDLDRGIITTIAGTGEYGHSVDCIPATEARLHEPCGIAVDPGARFCYVSDNLNADLRRIDLRTGIITTIAEEYYTPGRWGLMLPLGDVGKVECDAMGHCYLLDSWGVVHAQISLLGRLWCRVQYCWQRLLVSFHVRRCSAAPVTDPLPDHPRRCRYRWRAWYR